MITLSNLSTLALLFSAAVMTACAPETPEGDGGDSVTSALAGHAGASTGRSGAGGNAGAGAAGKASAGAAGGHAGKGGADAGAAGAGSSGAPGTGGGGAPGGAAGAAGLTGSSGGGAAGGALAGAGGSQAAGSAGSAGSAVGTAMHPGTPIKLTIVSMDWTGNQNPGCPGGMPTHLLLSITIAGKTYTGTNTCFDISKKCDELDVGLTVSGIHLQDIQYLSSAATFTLWNDQRSSGGSLTKCKTDGFAMQNPLTISADNEYQAFTPGQARVRIEKL